MPQLIRKFIALAQLDFIDLPVSDSSAGIDFFNGKTKVMLICELQTWFENIISYELPYNDNKMIILMNITLKWRVSTLSNSLKYLLHDVEKLASLPYSPLSN